MTKMSGWPMVGRWTVACMMLGLTACSGEPDGAGTGAGGEAASAPSGSRQGTDAVAAGSVQPELVQPGVISTEGNETFPAVDPVDGSLWFSTYGGGFDQQTIHVAARSASGEGWSEPVVAPFSGRWGDRAPRFGPDPELLYFTSNRPVAGDGTPGDMNIWRVKRTEGGWGTPELVGAPVRSTEPDIHAAVTEDGIWLASRRPGTLGASDIFRIAHGASEAEHLGPPVNDEHSQSDLWVSADERVMILVVTDHPDGLGGDDLYLSRHDGDGWSPPENLGPGINTAEYEYGPTVSPDGAFLYFTSHRNGSADVYRIPAEAVLGIR